MQTKYFHAEFALKLIQTSCLPDGLKLWWALFQEDGACMPWMHGVVDVKFGQTIVVGARASCTLQRAFYGEGGCGCQREADN